MADVTTHKRTQRHAATEAAPRNHHWPLLLIAAPAAVAIWAGWVGLASMCGFGIVHPLPGILDSVRINTAITLPVGVESYGAYALWVWLSGRGSDRTRTWARNSAFAALGLGCLGQVAFHLLAAAHWTEAPWPVVVAVACLPVVTLAFAATLIHMTRADAAAVEETGPASAAAEGAEFAVLRAELEAEQAAREAAEAGRDAAQQEAAEAAAKAEAVARKLAAALAPKRTRKPPARKPATQVPNDVDAQAEALAILAAEPDIKGAQLGPRVGKSERWGQLLKNKLATTAAASEGHDPEE